MAEEAATKGSEVAPLPGAPEADAPPAAAPADAPAAAEDEAERKPSKESRLSQMASAFDTKEERPMLRGELKNRDNTIGYLEENPIFQNTTLLVIVINAVWICIDVQWNHTLLVDANGKLPLEPWSLYVEHVFCFYFTAEVLIRFAALRHTHWFIFDAWLVFDSTLVLFMIVETWLMPLIGMFSDSDGADGALSSFSSFRLLRLLRLTRMARIMRFFPELMALVKGMVSAAKAVFFVLLFLIIITYVFAILFTSELGGGELPEPEEGADPTGKEMFSDLGSSMMSLFTRGVLGDNLASTLIAIKDESLLLMWIFIFFMVISGLTLLNMLIGVLCSVVEETSKEEEEKALADEMEEALLTTFRAADTSNDGLVSAEEWDHIRNSESVRKLLERMGVEEKEMEMRLAQMKDTLFGTSASRERELYEAEAGGPGSRKGSSTSIASGDKKEELEFSDFVEKILELRMDVPASALDIELCKAQAANADKLMGKTLRRIEDNLSSMIAQGGGAKEVPDGKEALKAPLAPRAAGEPAPAWLREVPTEMLFHVLKYRSGS